MHAQQRPRALTPHPLLLSLLRCGGVEHYVAVHALLRSTPYCCIHHHGGVYYAPQLRAVVHSRVHHDVVPCTHPPPPTPTPATITYYHTILYYLLLLYILYYLHHLHTVLHGYMEWERTVSLVLFLLLLLLLDPLPVPPHIAIYALRTRGGGDGGKGVPPYIRARAGAEAGPTDAVPRDPRMATCGPTEGTGPWAMGGAGGCTPAEHSCALPTSSYTCILGSSGQGGAPGSTPYWPHLDPIWTPYGPHMGVYPGYGVVNTAVDTTVYAKRCTVYHARDPPEDHLGPIWGPIVATSGDSPLEPSTPGYLVYGYGEQGCAPGGLPGAPYP